MLLSGGGPGFRLGWYYTEALLEPEVGTHRSDVDLDTYLGMIHSPLGYPKH